MEASICVFSKTVKNKNKKLSTEVNKTPSFANISKIYGYFFKVETNRRLLSS